MKWRWVTPEPWGSKTFEEEQTLRWLSLTSVKSYILISNSLLLNSSQSFKTCRLCVHIYTYLHFNLVIPEEKACVTLVENRKLREVRILFFQFSCPWSQDFHRKDLLQICSLSASVKWKFRAFLSFIPNGTDMTLEKKHLPAYRAGPHVRSEWC